MKRMSSFYQFRCMAWLCLILVPNVLTTAQEIQVDALEASASLPEDTLVVLRLDPAEIDVKAIADWSMRLETLQRGRLPVDSAAKVAKSYLDALNNAQTGPVTLAMAARDLQRGTPVVFCESGNPEVAAGLLSLLWSETAIGIAPETLVREGLLIMGSPETVTRLKSGKADQTRRFDAPLAARTLDHQLIVAISEDLRLDLAGVWPQETPAGSPIEFSPRQLIGDIARVNIQWSLPPEAAFEADVKATDAQAAERVRDVLERLVALLPELESQIHVELKGNGIVVRTDPSLTAEVMARVLSESSMAELRGRTWDNMQLVALAMHNYHSAFKEFPESAWTDPRLGGTFSWRFAIAPYAGDQGVWEAADRTQDWDSQANAGFGEELRSFLVSGESPASRTAIRLPAIDDSFWAQDGMKKEFRKIIDGTSNTIMAAVAPADQAVPWMKPDVWRLDEDDLLDSFFGDRDQAVVAMFDGSVHVLRRENTTEEKLRGLLTHAGKEMVSIRD